MFTHSEHGTVDNGRRSDFFQHGQGCRLLKGACLSQNMSKSTLHPSVHAEARSVFDNRLSALIMAGRANMNLC